MNISEGQKEDLLSMVNVALDILYREDPYLIKNEVHERSIVFRFCHYLQPLLQGNGYIDYNLDMEYNKNHSNPKQTINFPNGTYPDVILHQRGSNDHNLLLMEFKPWWNPDNQRDIAKIRDFTNQNEPYKYALGISLFLSRERRGVQITTIQDGEVVQ
jgi:hypothetical protein